MDKDLYTLMKIREGIVNKFLDKLDSVDVDEIQLLPAMMKFVTDGDETFFKEFCDFHLTKDIQTKRDLLAKKKKEYAALLQDIEHTQQLYQQNRDYYYSWMVKFRDNFTETIKSLDELQKIGTTTGDIMSLIEREKLSPYKKLYLILDGKIHKISEAYVHKPTGKVVFTVGTHKSIPSLNEQIVGSVL